MCFVSVFIVFRLYHVIASSYWSTTVPYCHCFDVLVNVSTILSLLHRIGQRQYHIVILLLMSMYFYMINEMLQNEIKKKLMKHEKRRLVKWVYSWNKYVYMYTQWTDYSSTSSTNFGTGKRLNNYMLLCKFDYQLGVCLAKSLRVFRSFLPRTLEAVVISEYALMYMVISEYALMYM